MLLKLMLYIHLYSPARQQHENKRKINAVTAYADTEHKAILSVIQYMVICYIVYHSCAQL